MAEEATAVASKRGSGRHAVSSPPPASRGCLRPSFAMKHMISRSLQKEHSWQIPLRFLTSEPAGGQFRWLHTPAFAVTCRRSTGN